jgi:hypothetical protein
MHGECLSTFLQAHVQRYQHFLKAVAAAILPMPYQAIYCCKKPQPAVA